MDRSGAKMLGAPVTAAAARPVMEAKLEDLERMVSRLQHIDSHSAFFLLKKVALKKVAPARTPPVR